MNEMAEDKEYGTTDKTTQESAQSGANQSDDMQWLVSDAPWTTDPAVNEFLADLELPPEPVLKQYLAERAQLEATAPREGEVAPDFRLEKLSPAGHRSGEFISPQDFRGRPLALLFGNYTCPVYRGQLEHFIAAHTEHGGRVSFLMIYIKEEHPEDGWQVGINHDQCVVYDQPRDADARASVAADLIERFGVTMPVVIDDMDNSVCDLYAGAPERLYLLDEDGMVVHRSSPGPFHMDAVEAWRQALTGL